MISTVCLVNIQHHIVTIIFLVRTFNLFPLLALCLPPPPLPPLHHHFGGEIQQYSRINSAFMRWDC